MIVIKPSFTADSRTSDVKQVAKEQLYASSIQHINDVRMAMEFFWSELIKASEKHDFTKVDEEGIDAFYDSFSKGLTNEEFKKEPWFQRHITEERHHLTDHVPDDVTLIDVLERVADITMAGLGRSGKVTMEDLDPEILQKAYRNTIKLLKNNVVIDND